MPVQVCFLPHRSLHDARLHAELAALPSRGIAAAHDALRAMTKLALRWGAYYPNKIEEMIWRTGPESLAPPQRFPSISFLPAPRQRRSTHSILVIPARVRLATRRMIRG